MKILKDPPSITVYSPDKLVSYGVISKTISFSKDIRFNAASEVEITVPKKYYDEIAEQWIENPIYDSLIEDNLLYIPDNNNYFRYPVRTIGDENFYIPRLSTGKVDYSNLPKREKLEKDWNPKNGYGHFTIQDETLLYDIGTESKYYFQSATLDDKGAYQSLEHEWKQYYHRACDSFIPVNDGDVVILNYFYVDNDNEYDEDELNRWYYAYKYRTYESNDAVTCVDMPYNTLGYQRYSQPSRLVVGQDLDLYSNIFPKINSESGYMRFAYEYNRDDWQSATIISFDTPFSGYIQILSGERRCTHIENQYTEGFVYPKLQWFVIYDVAEEQDGVSHKKIIKAYSYEYTLSKRTCSLAEDYCAFYIPPCIKNFVESNEWVVDNRVDTDGNTVTTTHPQKMKEGILNQILHYLPNWKVGYISSDLMTRYRKISEVDNLKVYPLLMNDIQSAFQCYIVFDTDNQTISAYTKEDILQATDVYFTWDNIIKNIDITNLDTTYVNSLRVHTSDDAYSISLVNPTGNNMLYNFEYSLHHMNKVVDNNRTIQDALWEWEQFYESSLEKYRELGKTLIDETMSEIKKESALDLARANYRAKVDEINIYLADNKQTCLSDSVLDLATIDSLIKEIDASSRIYDKYVELKSLSSIYWTTKDTLFETTEKVKKCNSQMKIYATQLSLSYKTESFIYEGTTYYPLLSKKERLYLDLFIKEGDWTNENVVFSETYGCEDIYNTLMDVYAEAKTDFTSRLANPNYEVTLNIANPFIIADMQGLMNRLYLGHMCNIEIEHRKWVYPTLLEIHLDYLDGANITFTFSTDYKRKPLHNRFADLFGTINQTSVKESAFIFAE